MTTFVEQKLSLWVKKKFHVSVSEKGEGGLRYGNECLPFSRRRVTNNMQIRSEIVSKFSNACNFLATTKEFTYREARR